MRDVEEYLAEMHEDLKYGYMDSQGRKQSCSEVARDIAEKIVETEYSKPCLMKARPDGKDRSGWPGSLTPIVLEEERWGAHVFCCLGNKAYDPLHPEPVELDNYAEKTFEEDDIVIEKMIGKDKIGEFIWP